MIPEDLETIKNSNLFEIPEKHSHFGQTPNKIKRKSHQTEAGKWFWVSVSNVWHKIVDRHKHWFLNRRNYCPRQELWCATIDPAAAPTFWDFYFVALCWVKTLKVTLFLPEISSVTWLCRELLTELIKGIKDAVSTADFRILFEIFEILEILDFFETFNFYWNLLILTFPHFGSFTLGQFLKFLKIVVYIDLL